MFSHSEDSSGYNGCDVKYGDVSDNSEFSSYSPYQMTNPAPYYSISSSVSNINIENTIKPKNMKNWFAYMPNVTNIDVSNIDSSNCESMYGCFNSKNISDITYGIKFVAPSTIDYMFCDPSTVKASLIYLTSDNGKITTTTLEQAPRPSWYDLDKVINIETICTDGWNWTYSFDCEGYNKLLAYDYQNKNGLSFTGMKFNKVNSNEKRSSFKDSNGNIILEKNYPDSTGSRNMLYNIPTNAKTANLEASLTSGPPLNYNGNNQEQKFTMKVLLVK